MADMQPLSIVVKPSQMEFYSIVAIHALSIVSILYVDNFNFITAVLKVVLALLVVLNFSRFLSRFKKNICLHFKSNDLVDLTMGDQEFCDLQLTSDSYISDFMMVLFFLEVDSSRSYSVVLFPDSLDAEMRSRLRSALTITSSHISAM